ncbi:MAG: hypothetical protein M3Y81_18155 [Chloroflexota bacterium]|nr:hypothetical protein [Chloroflexota bacterium]
MNRFEQRLQKRLQKKEIAEGYREMGVELELLSALKLTADITLRQAREGE